MSTIELKNVTLDIPVFDANRSFRKSLMNLYTGGRIMQEAAAKGNVFVRALDNISFRLEKGDRLGLVGHNGAGKTTLLRVLAGIYKPLIGNIHYSGKITSFLSNLAGLDADDTGLENIYSLGIYMGMTKREVADKIKEIVEFSELGDFIDLPVRTYSAGMVLRLGFAVITSVEPEILLMDEGIGAGDARFAKKAEKRLETFYSKLNVLVIASHSDDLIRQMCNKAMFLEHGKILAYGGVEEVLEKYHGST